MYQRFKSLKYNLRSGSVIIVRPSLLHAFVESVERLLQKLRAVTTAAIKHVLSRD